MNEQQFREEAAADGYTVGDVVALSADKFNDFHSHDFSAKLMILEGKITVTTEDGKATTCRANDTFQLDAGIKHTEQVGPEGVRILPSRK